MLASQVQQRKNQMIPTKLIFIFGIFIITAQARYSFKKSFLPIIRATPLQIPFEFTTVNYLCPSLVYKKNTKQNEQEILKLKSLVTSIKEQLVAYTDSLSNHSISMMNRGLSQISRDLMQSCSLLRRRVDDFSNIIDALTNPSIKESIVPAHGYKSTLIQGCLERSLGKKFPGFKQERPRRFKRTVHYILKAASSNRPMIIEKQQEIKDTIDIYDIWNHKTVWKLP